MTTKTTQKVDAGTLHEGDFLPGLDNGYVFEDAEMNPDFRDRYNVGLAHGLVCVSFHTAQGEESYLLCPPDMPVTVECDQVHESWSDSDEDDEDDDPNDLAYLPETPEG